MSEHPRPEAQPTSEEILKTVDAVESFQNKPKDIVSDDEAYIRWQEGVRGDDLYNPDLSDEARASATEWAEQNYNLAMDRRGDNEIQEMDRLDDDKIQEYLKAIDENPDLKLAFMQARKVDDLYKQSKSGALTDKQNEVLTTTETAIADRLVNYRDKINNSNIDPEAKQEQLDKFEEVASFIINAARDGFTETEQQVGIDSSEEVTESAHDQTAAEQLEELERAEQWFDAHPNAPDRKKGEETTDSEPEGSIADDKKELERYKQWFEEREAIESEQSDKSETKDESPEKTDEPEAEAKNESMDDQMAEFLENPEMKSALDRLAEARNNYAELTAKDRDSYLGRFLTSTSKYSISRLLRKIPGMSDALDRINDKLNEPTIIAKEQYEDSYDLINQKLMEKYQELEISDSEIKKNLKLSLLDEARLLEQETMNERQKRGPAANQFSNWWVSQKGFVGGLKKAGVLMGTGVAIGFGAGVMGVGVGVAGLAGGTAGLGIGVSITRRRAKSTVEGENKTVAELDSEKDYAEKERIITTERLASPDGQGGEPELGIKDLTDQHEQSTADQMRRNRQRLKKAFAAGSAGASLGNIAAQQFRSALDQSALNSTRTQDQPIVEQSRGTNLESQPPSGNTEANLSDIQRVAETVTNPESAFGAFEVEPGSGLIQEMSQFAESHGSSLTPEQGFKLFQDVRENFGDNGIIDLLDQAQSIYTQGNDLRIAAPGVAEWKDGVGQFMLDWIKNNVG